MSCAFEVGARHTIKLRPDFCSHKANHTERVSANAQSPVGIILCGGTSEHESSDAQESTWVIKQPSYVRDDVLFINRWHAY